MLQMIQLYSFFSAVWYIIPTINDHQLCVPNCQCSHNHSEPSTKCFIFLSWPLLLSAGTTTSATLLVLAKKDASSTKEPWKETRFFFFIGCQRVLFVLFKLISIFIRNLVGGRADETRWADDADTNVIVRKISMKPKDTPFVELEVIIKTGHTCEEEERKKRKWRRAWCRYHECQSTLTSFHLNSSRHFPTFLFCVRFS